MKSSTLLFPREKTSESGWVTSLKSRVRSRKSRDALLSLSESMLLRSPKKKRRSSLLLSRLDLTRVNNWTQRKGEKSQENYDFHSLFLMCFLAKNMRIYLFKLTQQMLHKIVFLTQIKHCNNSNLTIRALFGRLWWEKMWICTRKYVDFLVFMERKIHRNYMGGLVSLIKCNQTNNEARML